MINPVNASSGVDYVPLPDMDSPQDNRRTTRVHCSVPVTLRASDGRDIEATCLNINISGVGIETRNQLAVGQRLQLLVPKQGGEVKSVPMLVMYRMESHYGLSALEAHEHVLDLIPSQS